MDEHSSHTSEGHSLVSPTTVSAIVTRVVVSALDASGRKKAAQVIKNWPELLGAKIGGPFKKIEEKKSKGEEVTPEDARAFEKALNDNPKEAAALLGLLIASVTEETLDAEAERKVILESYAMVLNTLCALMAKARTSLALRGFIHEKDCISYWHLTGKNPHFAPFLGFLDPNNLSVFLLSESPTPQRLQELNEEIRRDQNRQLRPSSYDYRKRDTVARVKQISELSVTIEKLHPDREELKKKHGPFDLDPEYKQPREFTEPIPFGAPYLIPLFESVFEAKSIQEGAVEDLLKTRETLAENLKKLS